jgi:hypothetical protein
VLLLLVVLRLPERALGGAAGSEEAEDGGKGEGSVEAGEANGHRISFSAGGPAAGRGSAG